MAHIALMTTSDGRPAVHRDVERFGLGVQERIVAALRGRGHQVTVARVPLTANETAVAEARRLADARPDLTVVNIPVWAFPHFTVLAAAETPGPLALFSNVDPQYPGMVGMLAAGGALDQIGRVHARAWGDVSEAAVLDRLDAVARAAAAVAGLSGSTFGRLRGPAVGVFTAPSEPRPGVGRVR